MRRVQQQEPVVDGHLTNTEKVRALPWLVGAILGNGMFGALTLFGPMFPLYMDRVGLDKGRIGTLLGVIPLFSMLGLVVAPLNARVGLKRSHILYMLLRKLVLLGVLAVPWVAGRYGLDAAFGFVAAIVVVFSILRAMAETAFLPWFQEIVPESLRGRLLGRASVMNMAGMLSVTFLASWILAVFSGRAVLGYQLVMLLGIFIGLLGVVVQLWIPAESRQAEAGRMSRHVGDMRAALRDGNFLRLSISHGLVFCVLLGAGGFLPLYLKERVGLNPDNVVLSTLGIPMGGILLNYFWGWASDRFGARPAYVTGLAGSTLVMGLWLLLPLAGPEAALPLSLMLYVLMGAVLTSSLMSGSRYMYASAVPAERRNGYLAVYYAWQGLLGGLAPLAMGWSVDRMERSVRWTERLGGNTYLPALVGVVVVLGVATVLARGLAAAGDMPASRFAGVFFRGNPLLAMGAMVKYHMADRDAGRVRQIEKIGRSGSPLGQIELAEALTDPSFNVRYEAVHTIARGPVSEELVSALLEILRTGNPQLRAGAAWALARSGQAEAVGPLREALDSPYALLRGRAARALGGLGDAASCGRLRERAGSDPDEGVRLACVAALGELRDSGVAGQLFWMLSAEAEEVTRGELALAGAQLAGQEGRFIRLLRRMRSDAGMAAGTLLMDLRKKLSPHPTGNRDDWERAIDALSKERLDEGSEFLAKLCFQQADPAGQEGACELLRLCGKLLGGAGRGRPECIALGLHLLECSLSNGGD
jgi:MFS family permease